LTLILPKRVFAADEIARATVRVDNLTHRVLELDRRCEIQNPEVEIRAASGFMLYPPPVDFLSAPYPCPSHTKTLNAGASVVTYPYVIVRAKYLRASVTLAPQGVRTTGLGPGPFFVVRTPGNPHHSGARGQARSATVQLFAPLCQRGTTARAKGSRSPAVCLDRAVRIEADPAIRPIGLAAACSYKSRLHASPLPAVSWLRTTNDMEFRRGLVRHTGDSHPLCASARVVNVDLRASPGLIGSPTLARGAVT
jgi:hypothetical protein